MADADTMRTQSPEKSPVQAKVAAMVGFIPGLGATNMRTIIQGGLCSLALATAAVAASPAAIVPSIEGTDPYIAVPHAALVADNSRAWRTVFEAKRGADKPDQLVPAISMAGSELNTLHAHGVLKRNVSFVVVMHTTASDVAVLDDAHYRAKFGVANPNLPVLRRLKQAGVKVYVCGQQLTADGVPLSAVAPEATIAEDGLIAVMTFEGEGYSHLTF